MKHKMKTLLARILLLCCCCLSLTAQAAKVDSLKVYSDQMRKDVRIVTITPDAALTGKKCPVVYLLHGFGGYEGSWLKIKPNLPDLADHYGFILVCPDGTDSWYWDSPVVKNSHYESFVSQELVKYIDQHYATLPEARYRAITGLSMGGHGALWLAIRHPETFSSCGSMSGGLDIRPFPEKWNMKKYIGTLHQNKNNWDNYTVINQLDKIHPGTLAITIDCGADDFFYHVNCSVHEALLKRKIAHDFTIRPGAHTLEYWNNSIDYHLLFFQKQFARRS